MDDEYLIPSDKAESKIDIKKSRFIAKAAFTPTIRAAKDFIREVRENETGYSHAVYAYLIGYGNSVTCGMSDAGEPHGTAGSPVLEVLKGSGIGDITMVVIRYFGGTKLGKGGVVRAYTESAKETLKKLTLIRKIKKIYADISFAYKHFSRIENIISGSGGCILKKQFAVEVYCRIMVPENIYPHVIESIKNLCGGDINIKKVRE